MQEQTYIISSFKQNRFFLVKTEQKNERQLQNQPIKKPELNTQVFVSSFNLWNYFIIHSFSHFS